MAELPATDRDNADLVRHNLLEEGGRFLRNFPELAVHERDYRLESLKNAVSRVYDTLIVSTNALSLTNGSLCREILAELVSRAQQGIFVFVVQLQPTAELLQVFDANLPERLIILDYNGGKLQVQDVLALVDGRGLRLDRVLSVVGYPDEFIPYLEGLFRGLALPFAATSDSSAFKDKRLLPIAANGDLQCGAAGLRALLSGLVIAPRINVSEKAVEISGPEMAILDHFTRVENRARRNLAEVRETLTHLEPRLVQVPKMFDTRSGAITFRPAEWRQLQKSNSAAIAPLVDFFKVRLPYRQPDRPSFKRILYTPTIVLLRGEQYYVNMRNISPFDRMQLMLSELDELSRTWAKAVPDITLKQDDEWKLVLAFLDQLRSIALQIFSFAHAAAAALSGDVAETLRSLWGDRERKVHGLVRNGIHGYYSCIFFRPEEMKISVNKAFSQWSAVKLELKEAVDAAESELQREEAPRDLGSLVRRWREGDHPVENVVTATIAALRLKNEASLHAVGIGWGGIELPMMFDYVAEMMAPKQLRHVHIARWSHYRAPEKAVGWDHFPEHREDELLLNGGAVALFDDNTLTGLTLERVRDELLRRGAQEVRMFVTRYSGERRHAQMRMVGHGAVDPSILLQQIDGYIGETAFARSWSTKKYENPIGVFSLGRRRILECIYNNSTVESYEREGF